MAKEMNLTKMLKEYFGFDKFKGDQEAIIRNVISGNDTFVLMPTALNMGMALFAALMPAPSESYVRRMSET